jgi:hypothetical protein
MVSATDGDFFNSRVRSVAAVRTSSSASAGSMSGT